MFINMFIKQYDKKIFPILYKNNVAFKQLLCF